MEFTAQITARQPIIDGINVFTNYYIFIIAIMKIKLTTLLFGLLLAVGWTSSASAQALPEPCGATYKASDEAIRNLTYTWTDASNVSHESHYVVLNDEGKYEAELVTNPYQMYGLLRGVYMEKALPGPWYSAYTSSFVREDPVYYGGIDGGWDIPASPNEINPVGDITITTTRTGNNNYNRRYIHIHSIAVYDLDGNELKAWTCPSNGGAQFPNTWTITGATPTRTATTAGYTYVYIPAATGTITIPASDLGGARNVRVVINARYSNTGPTLSYTVDGKTTTQEVTGTFTDYTWNISGSPANSHTAQVVGDINITGNQYGYISSIKVLSGNTTLTSWDYATNGSTLPSGWTFDSAPGLTNDGDLVCQNGQIITLSGSMFAGLSSVTVQITAYSGSYNYYGNVYVNGTVYQYYNQETHNWTVNGTTVQVPEEITDYYKPNQEGYTVLVVAVKDETNLATQDAIHDVSTFNSRQEIINYFRDNVTSIRLLTDGLRIGSSEDYSRGTVYNCDGTYNKFFFLGKGQARKKCTPTINYQALLGTPLAEQVPFKRMFEQFSPTSGEKGSDIKDFYSEMMKGDVYNVVHDCASVIQQEHQFSLSGNSQTPEPFSFTGLNFFVPDYRLLYWVGKDSVKQSDGTYTYYDVDGRDMNAYELADATHKTGETFDTPSEWTAWYAQYNQLYAPQIGLYKITLDANAEKSADYDFDDETKRNYDITLHWVSSLDEMAGHPVDQIYTVYTWDEEGNRIELRPIGVKFFDAEGNELTTENFSNNPFVVTQVTYQWPQKATSQIFEYQVHGTPDDNEHPGFVAWSNTDYVVIPGWNDFLALKRNHYESDFVVNEEKNYYRNFLTVTNENEDNALTLERIKNGEDTYTLWRYDVANPNNMNPVADLTFRVEGNPATAKYVTFGVAYPEGSQQQLRPTNQPSKYDLGVMGVKTSGELCIHGNGDLIIEPNGTTVNFHSIVVKSGNTEISSLSWNGSGDLPSAWKVSPGAVWSTFEGKYYLEGQGYIYIPSTALANYQNITVTINASGDPGSVSRITVNDVMKKIANGAANDYTWTAEEVATDITSEDGMIRMGGLPIVDQFSESTAKNDHPEKYGYVLIYKKGTDDEKQSSPVEVPVQHTKSKVNGFYTEKEVKNDTDRELTTDVLTADVTLTLSDDNASIYHYILLSDAKNVVPEIDDARTDYVSYLQQRSGFTYREMNENSPLWVEENTFGWPAGEREYFNETEKLTGSYGDYKTYVPVVETTGFDRRWYEVEDSQYGDHLHNTYGSPVWKTSAGKVEGVTAAVQPQKGWNTTWTDNGSCRLYMLDKVVAKGYLPKAGVTNIEYEPYMFRIFVESPRGNLRHFKYETDDNGNRVITADEGSTTGPWCVWSEYLTLDEHGNILDNVPNGVTFKTGTDTNEETGETTGAYIEFHKDQVDGYDAEGVWNAEKMNAIFGALTSIETGENQAISKDDLKIYVRFYFKSTGGAIHSLLLTLRGDGDEEVPAYNAAEGEADTYQGPTAVEEIRYHGEVVSQTYFNVQGMESDKPFDGVNIVVTRFSDGTTSVSKVVR